MTTTPATPVAQTGSTASPAVRLWTLQALALHHTLATEYDYFCSAEGRAGGNVEVTDDPERPNRSISTTFSVGDVTGWVRVFDFNPATKGPFEPTGKVRLHLYAERDGRPLTVVVREADELRRFLREVFPAIEFDDLAGEDWNVLHYLLPIEQLLGN